MPFSLDLINFRTAVVCLKVRSEFKSASCEPGERVTVYTEAAIIEIAFQTPSLEKCYLEGWNTLGPHSF